MLLDGTWDGKGRLLGPLLVVCLGLLWWLSVLTTLGFADFGGYF